MSQVSQMPVAAVATTNGTTSRSRKSTIAVVATPPLPVQTAVKPEKKTRTSKKAATVPVSEPVATVVVQEQKKSSRKVAAPADPNVAPKKRNGPTISAVDTFDTKGIIIQVPRVTRILDSEINPVEFKAMTEIQRAAANVIKTVDGDVKSTIKAPIPFAQLSAETKATYKHAMASLEQKIRMMYEYEYVHALSISKKSEHERYVKMRAATKVEKKDKFNSVEFNKSFDEHFYDGLGEFRRKSKFDRDSVEVDEKTGVKTQSYTEWSHPIMAIGRTRIRLSKPIRYYTASFLDIVVSQLARNAIASAFTAKAKQVKALHAVDNNTVPTDIPIAFYKVEFLPFLHTLNVYAKMVKYATDVERAEHANQPAVEKPLHDGQHSKDFLVAVKNICENAKYSMAQQATAEQRAELAKMCFTRELRLFLSAVAVEILQRISRLLLSHTAVYGKRTISESLLLSGLQSIIICTGVQGCDKLSELVTKRYTTNQEYMKQKRDKKSQEKKSQDKKSQEKKPNGTAKPKPKPVESTTVVSFEDE